MKRWTRDVRRYAELARLSNLPTCITNVLVGCAIGAIGKPFPWEAVPGVALSVSLFYTMGMAFNDVADRDIDRLERSTRPIPSGRVTLREARVFVLVTGTGAVALLALFGWRAFVAGSFLLACILAYDLLHKRHAWAALLMGMCRGMIYVVAALAVGGVENWRVLAIAAALLTGYITLVTVIAQRENRADPGLRRWISPVLPVIVPFALLASPLPIALMSAVAGAAALVWILRSVWLVLQAPARPKDAILGWLSGICLLDALFLALLHRPEAAVLAVVCFGLTILGHRRIAGT